MLQSTELTLTFEVFFLDFSLLTLPVRSIAHTPQPHTGTAIISLQHTQYAFHRRIICGSLPRAAVRAWIRLAAAGSTGTSSSLYELCILWLLLHESLDRKLTQ